LKNSSASHLQNREKISVIIPTYNREGFLFKTIQSVLQQTYRVTEVLVCDDGSTDNSRQVVASIGDERVKWIDCGRWGRPAGPRNQGLTAASGDWVAFLDSDDEWLPQKMEMQIRHVQQDGKLAVCCNAYRCSEGQIKGHYLENMPDKLSLTDMFKTNYVICSSMVIHRSLISECKGFPESPQLKALEDYALWLRVASITDIAVVKQPLLNYHDEPGSSLRADGVSESQQRKLVFDDYKSWLTTAPVDRKTNIYAMLSDQEKTPRQGFLRFLRQKLRHIKSYLHL
jgi:teichuronic acid biosynthesis glycosyltransferase TuaG